MITAIEHRTQLLTRWSALKQERSSWDAHYAELSRFFQPRAGRFTVTDVNRGDRRWNAIYDSTGTRALRVLAAGMQAGMNSPARPWFRLAIPDAALMEYPPVRLWLEEVTRRMREVFSRSNTYRSLHTMFEEIGLGGTGASIIVDDHDKLIRHHTLTMGEYAISMDNRRVVDTIYREFNMSVRQLVREFGLAACSQTVKTLWANNNLEAPVTVVHAIEPRTDRDYSKLDSSNMAFKSCYFEQGADHAAMLRESGFNDFSGLIPRWALTSGDTYGFSPAMEALGDCKQLQHQQFRKSEAIDYKTKPPIALPTAMLNQRNNTLPGGIVYTDSPQKIEALWNVNLDLSHLLEDINDVRTRVNQAFYADLFLMLANDDRSNITAREIGERHEEKLLMLGPVLERLHNEMHDPLIDITFTKMLRSGLLPKPPKELEGMDVQIEFVSTLAQAQRAIGVQSIDRLIGTIGSVMGINPQVADKLDTDQLIMEYSDMLGVSPRLIVGAAQVALIRKDRAQQEQQQQAMAMAQPAADAASKLSQIDPNNSGMLSDVLAGLQGYSSGQ